MTGSHDTRLHADPSSLPDPTAPGGRRVLIVHAHPEPRSFTAALKDTAVNTLMARGDAVVVSDLYAQGWNPVASADDFTDRQDTDHLVYALEQRHADTDGSLAPDIRREVDRLLWADLLILSFPLYWYSVPAMKKGWFDRVLVSGRIYGGRRFYDRGGLAGKAALVALTLGGRERMFGPEGIHGPLEDMLRPVLRGTLGYTGMRMLPPFAAWHVPYVGEAERRAMLADFRAYLERLDDLEPLPMPRLDAYNDAMRPRQPGAPAGEGA